MQSILDLPFCPGIGKQAWPELVAKKGEEAVQVIESENRFVKAFTILVGTPITLEINCGRVRVWVDACDYVVTAPYVG
ncbi:hypothetical protein AAHA92_23664 [Salvia divinorum]|uniref:Uncharacterized protein n=1 Tax=Salvia divinorum TaxID=28513 RepID=A0ABD1GT36_SALDI